ncbi:Putative NADH-flavin reductase [Micrococcales bacterium KH10]|nr:Putative NADH-flavin reductase [Micrococcales bacterium KH10]
MRIVIVGGHGQIALQATTLLAAQGHAVVGLIRNPAHEADVVARGGTAAVLDIEQANVADLVQVIRGADAVVFAAGAGPGSGAERKWTVDRDGAMLTADAAEVAGVKRLVVVSAMNADDADTGSSDVFQIYLRAKAEADASVRSRDLDWTIIRPGSLTDEPGTGLVAIGEDVGYGSIAREDVAHIIVDSIVHRSAIRTQFNAIAGEIPVGRALSEVSGP